MTTSTSRRRGNFQHRPQPGNPRTEHQDVGEDVRRSLGLKLHQVTARGRHVFSLGSEIGFRGNPAEIDERHFVGRGLRWIPFHREVVWRTLSGFASISVKVVPGHTVAVLIINIQAKKCLVFADADDPGPLFANEANFLRKDLERYDGFDGHRFPVLVGRRDRGENQRPAENERKQSSVQQMRCSMIVPCQLLVRGFAV